MFTLLTILGLGFVIGMRHATDPDHVIAVATIVTRQRNLRQAASVGALWGLGHTITILAVGSAIILFKLVIPPRLGLSMELSVGVMLICLGILNLSGFTSWVTETLTPPVRRELPHSLGSHEAGRQPHRHHHAENSISIGWMDGAFGRLGPYQIVRPLAIGIVHGLAGSAAVALLVLSTIRNPVWAVGYLFVFGVGTIAGMMLITTVIAVPFTRSEVRFARFHRSLGMVSGLVSTCFGLFIVYQMGFVSGLFSRNPNWVPR